MKILSKCLVCETLEEIETGSPLIQIYPDTQYQDGMPVVGHMLCNKHQALYLSGYIALIEVHGEHENTTMVKTSDVSRTGRRALIKSRVLTDDVLNSMMGADGNISPIMYVESRTFDQVLSIHSSALYKEDDLFN